MSEVSLQLLIPKPEIVRSKRGGSAQAERQGCPQGAIPPSHCRIFPRALAVYTRIQQDICVYIRVLGEMPKLSAKDARKVLFLLQGYLAHKKTPNPLGPP